MHPLTPDIPFRRKQTEAWLTLFRIGRAMLRKTDSLFTEEGLDGVTPAQAGVLMVLFQERRPMHARELSEFLDLTEVTVSRFVAVLEREGWIQRRPDPDDARARLIEVTDRARTALPRFIRVSNQLLDESFAGFSRESLRDLAQAVEQVRRNLTPPDPNAG